jgi:hypothetical protein
MGPNSSDVLVARLGRIFVRNAESRRLVLPPDDTVGVQIETEHEQQPPAENAVHVARYEVVIQDMNVHNLNLEEKMRILSQSYSDTHLSHTDIWRSRSDAPWWSKLPTADIFSCKTSADRPILHDTRVHIDLGFFSAPVVLDSAMKQNKSAQKSPCASATEPYPDIIQANISVVHPLKISLTKTQYQQILETFNYALAFPDEPEQVVINRPRSYTSLMPESVDTEFDGFSGSHRYTDNRQHWNHSNEGSSNRTADPSVFMKSWFIVTTISTY